MTSQPAPALPTPSRPLLDAVFGDLWRDHDTPGHPRILAAAAAVGALGAVVLPWRAPGLGTFLVLTAAGAVAVAAGRHRWSSATAAPAMLCVLLLSTLVWRDALWIAALCVLAAGAVGAATLTGGRSTVGLLASLAAPPLAALRGLPWLGRSVRLDQRPAAWWPVVRTGVVTVVLVVMFGALFSSADAVFARWVGLLVPDLALDGLVVRVVVFVAVGGLTLTGAYVALVPPDVERLAPPPGREVRRFEWLVPVAAVIGTFVVFLFAQSAALFGGHDFLRRTTGLTYADYVHEGFGQLTLATVLTLAVVATAARRASRRSREDRLLLRTVLGLLCVLTLVVVASALYRMHVYEEAYGFTRLRLLVSAFEAWLGVLVGLVLVAGVALRGGWVPRAALLTGATMLLGLAVLNPDALIAERNIDRFAETGRIDLSYLQGLSADAVPALLELPEAQASCVVLPAGLEGDLLEWNLGRATAAEALEGADLSAQCPGMPETAMPERVL